MISQPSAARGLRDRGNLILAAILAVLATATAVLAARNFMAWKHGRIATELLTRARHGEISAAEQALASLDAGWIDADYARRCQLAIWSITDPARAFEMMEAVMAGQPREMQLVVVELAIRAGRYERAASLLESLGKSQGDASQVRFLQAWLALLQRDVPAALVDLRALLASEPTHRGGAFLRARLLLESSTYTEVVRARADLRTLSTGRDILGLEALVARALHRNGTSTSDERREVYQAIVDHPLARHAHFMREGESLAALLAASEGLPPATVIPLARWLHEIAPDDPRALSSLAFFLHELRKPADASPLVARLEQLDPDSETTLQLRCRQLILQEQPVLALALLEAAGASVAAAPRMAGLLGDLVDSTQGATLDVRRRALELGLALPPHNFPLWLDLRRRAIALLPARRDEIIAEVCAHTTGARALPAAEWLLMASEFESAISAATPALASGSEKARTIIFEARLGLGDFEAAAASVDGLSPTSVQGALLRARLAVARGDPAGGAAAWRAGFTTARRGSNPAAMLQLAAGAARLGLDADASGAFSQVSDRITAGKLECDARTAATWLTLELRLGASRTALSAARVLIARTPPRTPGNAEGRFWESYLGLLLGEDVLGSKDTAQTLSVEMPNDARFRALHALAQLKTGQNALALSTINRELTGDGAAPADLPLQVRVIAAAVCEASGQSERAAIWKQTLANQTLLPEEKALVALEGASPLASAR